MKLPKLTPKQRAGLMLDVIALVGVVAMLRGLWGIDRSLPWLVGGLIAFGVAAWKVSTPPAPRQPQRRRYEDWDE